MCNVSNTTEFLERVIVLNRAVIKAALDCHHICYCIISTLESARFRFAFSGTFRIHNRSLSDGLFVPTCDPYTHWHIAYNMPYIDLTPRLVPVQYCTCLATRMSANLRT